MQRIEPAKREGKHPREPKADDEPPSGKREEARGEHHHEQLAAEPAPDAAIFHHVQGYTKQRSTAPRV